MNTGRVYWITGLHNSGKTTIGTALYYELKKTHNNVIILDGDIMKEIVSGSKLASFNRSDRFIRAKRYSAIAKLLADQGLWVIVCAIAMFDEVRDWNRKNIKGYVEVFLDVPDQILHARTIKDEIYGMGCEVAHNAFIYNNHFRRFIDVNEFRKKLENMGFKILSIIESKGLSKTETSDPVLMRLVATPIVPCGID